MLAFLKCKHNDVLVFYHSELDESTFCQVDWYSTPYGDCKEDIPSNVSNTRWLGFIIRDRVLSDHVGDCTARRFRTGFIIHLNYASTFWYSKFLQDIIICIRNYCNEAALWLYQRHNVYVKDNGNSNWLTNICLCR